LVILRDWRSRWYGEAGKFRSFLKADVLLREYLQKKLRPYSLDGIEFERGANSYKIIIKTARPGMIIGRSGEGVTKLRTDIMAQLKRWKIEVPKDVRLEIEEVRVPEKHAAVVAMQIAESLEKRLTFRRVMKQAIEKVSANRDVQGVRVVLSGRLGGADMSRREALMKGRLPLQTLRADIDFAREKAHMSYGDIGIKVWIYRGEIFEAAKKSQTQNEAKK
jgi:small subunit ribosomal protein S3